MHANNNNIEGKINPDISCNNEIIAKNGINRVISFCSNSLRTIAIENSNSVIATTSPDNPLIINPVSNPLNATNITSIFNIILFAICNYLK